jgi:hypothetical protein
VVILAVTVALLMWFGTTILNGQWWPIHIPI